MTWRTGRLSHNRCMITLSMPTIKLSYLISRLGQGGGRWRGFKSVKQASDSCWFNLGCHLVRAETYQFLRMRSFACWENAAMT